MKLDSKVDLARAFAASLRQLNAAWDVQYVNGRARTPSPSPAATKRGADQVASAAHPPSPGPRTEPRVQPSAVETSSAGASGPTVDRRTALREQARSWSPAMKLEYLRRHNVGDCHRCELSKTRKKIVFGVGSAHADLMFVGEAPGADEDRQGEPFVGRAGQRLNEWLQQLGLSREEVYIANVLKCRPPGNRDPKPPEVDRCSPFLKAQIRAINPKVIVALGRHAGMLLSRREEMTLRAMRASSLHYDASDSRSGGREQRIPLVVTYHPSYVLRQEGVAAAPGRASPAALVMEDLRKALSIARRSS